MKRPAAQGYLPIDFPVEPFHSPVRLLLRSAAVFFSNFAFISTMTLAVFLPAKAALQVLCWMLDISAKGLTMYLLLDVSDLVLASLVTPAVIYGLLVRVRGGRLPPFAE